MAQLKNISKNRALLAAQTRDRKEAILSRDTTHLTWNEEFAKIIDATNSEPTEKELIRKERVQDTTKVFLSDTENTYIHVMHPNRMLERILQLTEEQKSSIEPGILESEIIMGSVKIGNQKYIVTLSTITSEEEPKYRWEIIANAGEIRRLPVSVLLRVKK